MTTSRTLFLFLSLAFPVYTHSAQYQHVTDIIPGSGSGGANYPTVYNGELFFTANDAPGGSNVELWKWNGTNATLVADIRPGSASSGINSLTLHNGKIFFTARDDSSTLELWSYDTTNGPQEIPDNSPQWNPQNPSQLISFDGDLYFQATDFSTVDTEFGRYDGTTIHPIDLIPGDGSSLPQHFTIFQNNLYFSAATIPSDGAELTRLNANKTSASRVANINQVSGGSSPANFAYYNGSLYFSAYDGVNGTELWRYTPNANPEVELVADIQSPGQFISGAPSQMTTYNNKLYFAADDGTNGLELGSLTIPEPSSLLLLTLTAIPLFKRRNKPTR